MIEPQMGRPLEPFNDDEQATLFFWVGEDLMLSNAARHVGCSNLRLTHVLEQGEEDLNVGIDSKFAHIFKTVRKRQATKISEILNQIRKCPKNWQALAWTLERCFKEDFSSDSEMYKKLLEDFLKMRDDVKRYTEQPLQGLVANGKVIRSKKEEAPQK